MWMAVLEVTVWCKGKAVTISESVECQSFFSAIDAVDSRANALNRNPVLQKSSNQSWGEIEALVET